MGGTIGRIEVLPDPLALAHHVAAWMTQAALASQGPFRVSLSGGSTPQTSMDYSPRMNSEAVSPGRAFLGTGATNASCRPIIPRAIIG